MAYVYPAGGISYEAEQPLNFAFSSKVSEVEEGNSSGSSSPDEDDEVWEFAVRKKTVRICGIACLSCCCASPLIVLLALIWVGRSLVMLRTQSYNAQAADTTPAEFPRYSSCGGCKEGNKTNAELEACLMPCVNATFVLEWEKFSKENDFKLVYFPSRPGPRGEASVNISAWWLPAPSAGGKPAPRIVALHGLGSNCNHCGVQSTCYLLRSMGFSCLTPSARDGGLSGKSDHPEILSWGYDYHLDALGGWDYAVADPEGLLGGALPTDQVGVMGFSKGALEMAIAFGLEPRIPGAWLDSGPYGGLFGMIVETVKPFVGKFFGTGLARIVFGAAKYFSGGRVDLYDPLQLLANCDAGSEPRFVEIAHGVLDSTVPVKYSARANVVLSALPHCYKVNAYTPPAYCNGATHHQEMWEFPDDTRRRLCWFWSLTFKRDQALCRLDELPSFQQWAVSGNLPPGGGWDSVI